MVETTATLREASSQVGVSGIGYPEWGTLACNGINTWIPTCTVKTPRPNNPFLPCCRWPIKGAKTSDAGVMGRRDARGCSHVWTPGMYLACPLGQE